MREDISACKDLDSLMRYWKEKQPIETSYTNSKKEHVDITIDHGKNFFIPDGIVDENVWNTLPKGKKILYVFKEAYEDDHNKQSWALNTELRDYGPWGMIWNRICEWTYGIHMTNISELPRYKVVRDNEWLRKIAVMNLKKSGGLHQSEYEEISAYAKADKEEIIREIELIDPDIVICGATFGDINTITDKKVNKGSNDNWYYYTDIIGRRRLYIDYYHPSNRFPSLLNFYGLVGIYQQALKEEEHV